MIVFLEGGLGDQLVRVAHALLLAERIRIRKPIRFISLLTSQYNASLPGQNQGIRAINLGVLGNQHRGISGHDVEASFLLRTVRWIVVRLIPPIRELLGRFDPVGRSLSLVDIGQKSQHDSIVLSRSDILRAGLPEVLEPRKQSQEYESLSHRAGQSKVLGVHIRLGDFRRYSLVLPPSYYHDEVQRLLEVHDWDSVWLFSDEPEDAQAMVPPSPLLENISQTFSLTVAEELCLLAKCHGLVLSSSNFSSVALLFRTQDGPAVLPPNPKKTTRI